MKIVDDSIVRVDNQNLAHLINQHTKDHGWSNTAKVLREVVFVHVGWDSDFTELNNVLHRIERVFEGETREVTDTGHEANAYTEDKLDNPDLLTKYYNDTIKPDPDCESCFGTGCRCGTVGYSHHSDEFCCGCRAPA